MGETVTGSIDKLGKAKPGARGADGTAAATLVSIQQELARLHEGMANLSARPTPAPPANTEAASTDAAAAPTASSVQSAIAKLKQMRK